MKVGDKVIVICRGYGRENKIAEIERETKNYWVVGDYKYKKGSLHSIGDNPFTSSFLKEYNKKVAKDIKKSSLERRRII